MAVALVQEFPIVGDDRTTANYDSFQERLGTICVGPDRAYSRFR
jgi:hypothetical protein